MSDGLLWSQKLLWNSGICSSFPHLRESGICHSERLVIINPQKKTQTFALATQRDKASIKMKTCNEETVTSNTLGLEGICNEKNLTTELHKRIDMIERFTAASYGHNLNTFELFVLPRQYYVFAPCFIPPFFLSLVTYAKDTAYSFLMCNNQDKEQHR